MPKSKSRIHIDYNKIAIYVFIIVCFLSIAIGYGLYKKQSFSTIFNNILSATIYSGRSSTII